jgi:hypothetical protein
MNEKALLLLVYSFLLEAVKRGDLQLNKSYAKLSLKNSMFLYSLFKKLKITHKTYANKKVQNFLFKRVKEPDKSFTIDIVYLAILLLYFYRIADIKRKITPISIKEAKELLDNLIKEDLNTDEVIAAKEIFVSIYPEKKEIAEFITNRIFERLKEKNERENCKATF